MEIEDELKAVFSLANPNDTTREMSTKKEVQCERQEDIIFHNLPQIFRSYTLITKPSVVLECGGSIAKSGSLVLSRPTNWSPPAPSKMYLLCTTPRLQPAHSHILKAARPLGLFVNEVATPFRNKNDSNSAIASPNDRI